MNLNDFKIFQAVAEYGSFTKAAAVMNTVQSNVTARIKFLEEQFNAQLLNRTTRRIELTDAGLKVLKVAKEVQILVEEAKSSIGEKEPSPKGIIKIGCIHSTASTNSTLEHLKGASKPVKLVVFSNGCSYRDLLGKILADMGFGKYKFIELDTLDGMINTVESGIGITLLPVELIKKHYSFRSLVTFPLPARFAKSQTVFIKRKDFPMSEGYALFLRSIIDGYSSGKS